MLTRLTHLLNIEWLGTTANVTFMIIVIKCQSLTKSTLLINSVYGDNIF